MQNISFNSDRLRLLLTDECNYSCPYCHNEGQFSRKNFIGLDKIHKLVSFIEENKVHVRSLTLSGGEPTLHKNLVEIVYALRTVTPNISMVTNGELLNTEKIDALAKAGLEYIKFGIDSLTSEKTKPQNLNSKSTPTKVMSNLFYSKQILPKTLVNTVVSKYNINKIREWIQFSDKNKISIKFLELIETNETIKSINPIENKATHNWFGNIIGEIGDLVSGVRYNPIVKKFYVTTIKGNVTLQFSEDFCFYGTCGDLWSRMDSRGWLIPCIKDAYSINPHEDLGNALIRANEEMMENFKWPCRKRILDDSVFEEMVVVKNDKLNNHYKFPLTDQCSCA